MLLAGSANKKKSLSYNILNYLSDLIIPAHFDHYMWAKNLKCYLKLLYLRVVLIIVLLLLHYYSTIA